MLPGLSTAKLVAIGAAFVIVVSIFGFQRIQIADLRAEVAELERDVARFEDANGRQASLIDQLTADKATFERRADAAEAALATARARVEVRTETIIKRITERAQPQDNQPVTPAIGSALASIRDKIAP